MAQQIVENCRFQIHWTVRRIQRALVVTRHAILFRKRTRPGCFHGRLLRAGADAEQCRRNSNFPCRTDHFSLVTAAVSGPFFGSLSVVVALGAGGGCGAGSLGPRCISSRKAAITSCFEL